MLNILATLITPLLELLLKILKTETKEIKEIKKEVVITPPIKVEEPVKVPDEPVVEPVVEEKPEVKFEIKDIVDKLPVSTTKRYPKRNVSQITQVTIHHSATESGTPSGFANFHIESRGWPGIGYHFVIDKKGQIFYTNYLNTVSYHVQNANTRSIGVCLVGNFDKELPTAEQIASLKFVIAYLNNTLNKKLIITKHNQFATKSCPGKNMDAIVEEIKKDFK